MVGKREESALSKYKQEKGTSRTRTSNEICTPCSTGGYVAGGAIQSGVLLVVSIGSKRVKSTVATYRIGRHTTRHGQVDALMVSMDPKYTLYSGIGAWPL